MPVVPVQRNPLEELARHALSLLEQQVEQHWLSGRREVLFPPVNIFELEDAYSIHVEVPGVRLNEIQIEATDSGLFLAGHRRPPVGVPDEAYRRQERWVGSWNREISFPKRIEPTRIHADLASGLLSLTVPKAESTARMKVPVHPRKASDLVPATARIVATDEKSTRDV